ncbi:hypothetical protein D9M68_183820 [compost metagenome]
MGFADPQFGQLRQRLAQQPACQPLPPMGFVHRQMLQVAAPPVVADQKAAQDLPIALAKQTQAGIAPEIGAEWRIVVLGTQLNTRRALPKGQQGGMVVGLDRANRNHQRASMRLRPVYTAAHSTIRGDRL